MNIRLTRPDGVKAVSVTIGCGDRKMTALVLSPEGGAEAAPGVLWIHGGGYITGLKEMVYMSRAVDLVKKFGAVVVSPGYRLALRHPYPAALKDCYAALLWMKAHAEELHIRPDQLMVGGESAGGGLGPVTGALWHNAGSVFVVVNAALLLREKGRESRHDIP